MHAFARRRPRPVTRSGVLELQCRLQVLAATADVVADGAADAGDVDAAGSSRSQSGYRLPRKMGRASPQPPLMTWRPERSRRFRDCCSWLNSLTRRCGPAVEVEIS